MTIATDIDLLRLDGAAAPAVISPDTFAAVAAAASDGLLRRRKRLPPWLLYDQRGSALFEAITLLPEYYLTRTEHGILAANADAMIEAGAPPLSVVELGAGSATKTRLLLAALLRRQPRADYTPVDVSPAALLEAQQRLRDLTRLTVRPVLARYPDHLDFLRAADGRRLVLFLGSNIGNYDPGPARRLLRGVQRHLRPGDALLIGTDLRKSPALLVPAYDDARGVTAAFTMNLLRRLNRELGAAFEPQRFRHLALWNRAASRMDLYLESTVAQRVPIRALGVEIAFAAGERIHTESSYKFTLTMVRQMLVASGFRLQESWFDPNRWFAVHLARVSSRPSAR